MIKGAETGGVSPDVNFNIRIREPYKLEIFRGDQTTGRSLDSLRERMALIYFRGFGVGVMQTAEEVKESMVKGGSVFIVSENGNDVAFSAQHIMRIPIPTDDKGSERFARVLFTSSRLVLPEFQGKGIGTWTMDLENEEHRPDFFAGRSQNPAIHLGWESRNFTGENRPIVTESVGEDLRSRQYTAILWEVAKRTSKRPVNPVTGLAEGVYKEGETRGYEPDLTNKRYEEIDRRMQALGLKRANGDTLYYVIEKIGFSQDEVS